MNGEEIDVEALQAQIDLSNSVAFDLVSSWMKPVPSNGPAVSVSSSIARELEEYAKRPPRLGLGASMSKASAATAREAAKLKGKLIGSKRAREDGGEASTSGAAQIQQEEDDGESRSAAISTKKPKLNGTGNLTLGLGKKEKGKGRAVPIQAANNAGDVSMEDGIQKKKRKGHPDEASSQDGAEANALESSSKSNPFVIPETPPAVHSIVNLVSPSPLRNVTQVVPESPNTPKRKRKRKHKKHTQESQTEVADEWHGFSVDVSDELDIIGGPDDKPPGRLPNLSTNNHSKETKHSTPSPVIDLASSAAPIPHPPSNQPKGPLASPKAPKYSTTSSVIDLTSSAVSMLPLLRSEPKSLPASQRTKLLNLDGPPSGTEPEGTEDRATKGNSKKKKRRRGKGRKSHDVAAKE